LRFAFGSGVSVVVGLLRFLVVVFVWIVRTGGVNLVVFCAGFALVSGSGCCLVVLGIMHVEAGEFGVIFGLCVAFGKRLGLRRIERVLRRFFALGLGLFVFGFGELLGERSHFIGGKIGFLRGMRLKQRLNRVSRFGVRIGVRVH